MQVLFQIGIVIVACTAVYMVVGKRRAGRLSNNAMLFWIMFWILVAGVALYPESASQVAVFFGIGRGVDVLMYSAILVLFFLMFKLHITLEIIRRDITTLVRKDTLEQAKTQKSITQK